jgi:hypothetical protein
MAKAQQKAAVAEAAEVEQSDSTAEPVAIGIAEEENEGDAVATGYIRDFISGVRVRATPEEVQATQVFSRRLVEDFGYPIDHITTRPQFRVSRRPSETKKSYPVDIAVFSTRSGWRTIAPSLWSANPKPKKPGASSSKSI